MQIFQLFAANNPFCKIYRHKMIFCLFSSHISGFSDIQAQDIVFFPYPAANFLPELVFPFFLL